MNLASRDVWLRRWKYPEEGENSPRRDWRGVSVITETNAGRDESIHASLIFWNALNLSPDYWYYKKFPFRRKKPFEANSNLIEEEIVARSGLTLRSIVVRYSMLE